jgi:hypothetical protein
MGGKGSECGDKPTGTRHLMAVAHKWEKAVRRLTDWKTSEKNVSPEWNRCHGGEILRGVVSLGGYLKTLHQKAKPTARSMLDH